ncbi:hypothetical protein HHI36_024264 [Cryptolaemus montrouzieri]|uniref:Uncharacterized protein n=1 Tax=Cryptolaemus montrouzieri TaxID=559131 RepID=A0ABD2P410_9CUCU
MRRIDQKEDRSKAKIDKNETRMEQSKLYRKQKTNNKNSQKKENGMNRKLLRKSRKRELYQYIKKQNMRKTFNNIENSEWIAHFMRFSVEKRNPEMCEWRDNKSIDNKSETALTKVEYEEIIGNLKNKMSSGPDSITNEMIIYGGRKMLNSIYERVKEISETE